MASLNLIPNPDVLVVQAGIFLGAVAVVKKLFVEPYLTVKDRREALTVGSKDEAARLLAEAEVLSNDINARLQAAYDLAKADRERRRQEAMAKRQVLLDAAEKESRAYIESVEQQVRANLAEERTKVPAITESLTEEVYQLALA